MASQNPKISLSLSTQSLSYQTDPIDISTKKREFESSVEETKSKWIRYNPDSNYLDNPSHPLSKDICYMLPDDCYHVALGLENVLKSDNWDKREKKLMELLQAKSSPKSSPATKLHWFQRSGEQGSTRWYDSLDPKKVGDIARTCKLQALKSFRNGHWDFGRTYVNFACIFADHPKITGLEPTWKQEMLEAAALTCQETAYESFAQFRWEDGKAGIDLAYEFGNQLGDEKWFKVYKEVFSKGAAQVCERLALQYLSNNLGPQGVMGIQLTYILGKKSDDVTWFEGWKQDMLKKAAEAFSEGATVVPDKANWKELQARIDVARAFGKASSKDWWFREWNMGLLKNKALTCEQTAMDLFSHGSWKTGEAWLVLACELGNQSGNGTWALTWEKEMLGEAIKVIERKAKTFLREGSWEYGKAGVALACVLHKKLNTRLDILEDAATICFDKASTDLYRHLWKSGQAGFTLARAFCKESYNWAASYGYNESSESEQLKRVINICRGQALKLLFSPSWSSAVDGFALACIFSDDLGDRVGKKEILKEAADECKTVALRLLSSHSWADGEIGIGLACDFGNELGEKVLFDEKKTLRAAAQTCRSEALKVLSRASWESGETGIDLACKFGNQMGDKAWFDGWKKEILTTAAETCASGALKLLSKSTWERGEMGIKLACKFGNQLGNKAWFDGWKKEILTTAAKTCKEVALQLLYKRCGSSDRTVTDLAGDNKDFQHWIKIAKDEVAATKVQKTRKN